MYNEFILMLPLEDHIKESFQKDLLLNWICDEWYMSFIDGGHLPYKTDNPYAKPLTTNNFTERMNKSLESQHSNAKTVIDFVENLYGIQKVRSTLSKENSGQLTFHASLIQDIKNSDYFYVRKGNNTFHSPYNLIPIKLNNKIQLEISKMVEKLNGSFYDICKHCHAAQLFKSIQKKTESLETIKSTEDEEFQEIIRLYNEVEDAIFYPYKWQLSENDPFRLLELSECNTMIYRSPKTHRAKP
ncbi:7535_t:CDS:2 [Scutellospora calospora]|uniref:7535_t:CDS:1 n=1 Tax=Scutellospora calospora TaxID=85575 RepID=A0ACA9MX28_9GLOM|nr:7535_t:CDS:2 [Scutellospora calospora]